MNTALKFVHLVSLIGWTGFSTGAWLYMRFLRRGSLPTPEMRRAFARITDIEHLFFVLLVASGLWMLLRGSYDLTRQGFLLVKVVIVFGIFLPLEILDVIFTNVVLARALRTNDAAGFARYDLFFTVAGWAFALLIPFVIVLIVFQPF